MGAHGLLSISSDLAIGYIGHLLDKQFLGRGTMLGAWVRGGSKVNILQGAPGPGGRATQQDDNGRFTTSR